MGLSVTEPTSAAVGAALGAGLLSAVGIEPAPLFWALVGASLGMSFAAATGRGRAVVVFAAVVLCCSLFGSWLAQRYLGGDTPSRSVAACLLAIWFHPALNAAIGRFPGAFDALLRKLGIGE